MTDNKFGVITEQGYPVGEFGFRPLNEEDQEQVKKSEADKKAKDENK